MIEGAKKIHNKAKISRDDIYTFCYTSGTTGTPKAALLSHGNIMANIAASRITYFVIIPFNVQEWDLSMATHMYLTFQFHTSMKVFLIGWVLHLEAKSVCTMETLRSLNLIFRNLNRVCFLQFQDFLTRFSTECRWKSGLYQVLKSGWWTEQSSPSSKTTKRRGRLIAGSMILLLWKKSEMLLEGESGWFQADLHQSMGILWILFVLHFLAPWLKVMVKLRTLE